MFELKTSPLLRHEMRRSEQNELLSRCFAASALTAEGLLVHGGMTSAPARSGYLDSLFLVNDQLEVVPIEYDGVHPSLYQHQLLLWRGLAVLVGGLRSETQVNNTIYGIDLKNHVCEKGNVFFEEQELKSKFIIDGDVLKVMDSDYSADLFNVFENFL